MLTVKTSTFASCFCSSLWLRQAKYGVESNAIETRQSLARSRAHGSERYARRQVICHAKEVGRWNQRIESEDRIGSEYGEVSSEAGQKSS